MIFVILREPSCQELEGTKLDLSRLGCSDISLLTIFENGQFADQVYFKMFHSKKSANLALHGARATKFSFSKITGALKILYSPKRRFADHRITVKTC